ncbi:MAG: glycosyltransferase family 4 protein [Actinomycetota bacterium]|nr:glycosyltransferase family 4 protein [Actinomycetota bacterium]
MTSTRVLMGCYFYPRGGSAHAARALTRQLRANDVEVTVLAGSRDDIGPVAQAERFFGPEDLHVVDYTPALGSERPTAFKNAAGSPPMHASFEDRPGAQDTVFVCLDDDLFELQVEAWARGLSKAGAAGADVLYLNHLTPMNEAAARELGDIPVIGHIHGPELLMLERIAEGAPASWLYAEEWRKRICRWGSECERLVVNTPQGGRRAAKLLGIDEERFAVIPNGFDPAFKPREVDRRALWRKHLVEEPQGWRPDERPGSVSYSEKDLDALEGTTLLYSGRFTEVKRLPLLIEAYAKARVEFDQPTALVLLGGYPGEWEGEHPIETVERLGVPGVFLAGWHDHEELPDFLSASDVLVHASVNEQFGQVLVEAMACGLPVVAVNRGGPASIVENGETGWLVEPEDGVGMAAAMVEAVCGTEERKRRGVAAREDALERYSWEGVGESLLGLLDEVKVASEVPAPVG